MNPSLSNHQKKQVVILRGGGDLASGIALRLHKIGIHTVITELSAPQVVRRTVAFASACFETNFTVEGVTARKVQEPFQALDVLENGEIPVLVDPTAACRNFPLWHVTALIDARMTKKPANLGLDAAPLVIGLGPGFVAGANCHAAIETNRGHHLGRVIWDGMPEPNTGVPGKIGEHQHDRVLRAPAAGTLTCHVEIGAMLKAGNPIASVGADTITAPFDGVLRGLLREGLTVHPGMKIGDIDPRNNPALVNTISEKALAIAGGVLEALLTPPEIRRVLWN